MGVNMGMSMGTGMGMGIGGGPLADSAYQVEGVRADGGGGDEHSEGGSDLFQTYLPYSTPLWNRFGAVFAILTGSGGKYLFHRIGWKGRIWQLCQKCTSKGIRRQGLVLKRRNSLPTSLCPVVVCPYLCSSELVFWTRRSPETPKHQETLKPLALNPETLNLKHWARKHQIVNERLAEYCWNSTVWNLEFVATVPSCCSRIYQ